MYGNKKVFSTDTNHSPCLPVFTQMMSKLILQVMNLRKFTDFSAICYLNKNF